MRDLRIIDYGLPDDAHEIAERLSEKDQRIVLFETGINDNYAMRNLAASCRLSESILLPDADHSLSADHPLEAGGLSSAEPGIILAYSKAIHFDEHRSRRRFQKSHYGSFLLDEILIRATHFSDKF